MSSTQTLGSVPAVRYREPGRASRIKIDRRRWSLPAPDFFFAIVVHIADRTLRLNHLIGNRVASTAAAVQPQSDPRHSSQNKETNMSALHWTASAVRPRAAQHTFGLLGVIGEWLRRIESRHELAGLCDRALRDIGLTRVDAMREARKPFWRA